MYIRHHILNVNTIHSIKLTKIYPIHIRNITYLKSQQKLKNQVKKGSNHEILRENKKTHTFFLKIKVEMMSNNDDFSKVTG